jgi:hypothetical protein
VRSGTNNRIKLNMYFICSPLSKQVDRLVTFLECGLGSNCLMLLNKRLNYNEVDSTDYLRVIAI